MKQSSVPSTDGDSVTLTMIKNDFFAFVSCDFSLSSGTAEPIKTGSITVGYKVSSNCEFVNS